MGLVGWDIGEPDNGIIKEDILKKIADGGYEFNDLYELVPVGGQDFSQVLPKIKANEPDILLVSIYGQDPGSFANQASTAGLHGDRGSASSSRLTASTPRRARTTRTATRSPTTTSTPKNPVSPLAKMFVEEFIAEYGEDPDFYAANFYENAFVMWEVMRRIWATTGGEITGRRARRGAAREPHRRQRLRRRRETVGTYTLDARPTRSSSARWASSSTRTAASPRRRSSASAAPDYRPGLSDPLRPDRRGRRRQRDLGRHLRDVPPTDRRRVLPGLQLRPARRRLRADPRRHRRFHFAYGFTYTLAAYLAFTFTFRVELAVLARRP